MNDLPSERGRGSDWPETVRQLLARTSGGRLFGCRLDLAMRGAAMGRIGGSCLGFAGLPSKLVDQIAEERVEAIADAWCRIGGEIVGRLFEVAEEELAFDLREASKRVISLHAIRGRGCGRPGSL